jgi:putative sigma-54 modulation protein
MDISITVHNMELTPRLKEHVERKTGRLDRYMAGLDEVQVELTQQNSRSAGDRQIAQMTIRDARGTILRAEERNSDMFTAVDAVVDKLYRQIHRYQGKRLRNRRAPAGEAIAEPVALEEEAPGFEEEADEATSGAIVRRKRFALRPMAPDEAIEQLELLGHDFYVFYNVESDGINVIYRRLDGDYGLLEPTLD